MLSESSRISASVDGIHFERSELPALVVKMQYRGAIELGVYFAMTAIYLWIATVLVLWLRFRRWVW